MRWQISVQCQSSWLYTTRFPIWNTLLLFLSCLLSFPISKDNTLLAISWFAISNTLKASSSQIPVFLLRTCGNLQADFSYWLKLYFIFPQLSGSLKPWRKMYTPIIPWSFMSLWSACHTCNMKAKFDCHGGINLEPLNHFCISFCMLWFPCSKKKFLGL